MATMKDVARLANVDVSTVSRALNNTSYVHPETKERILAAAKQLGYHPNAIAQALRQGRSHTIGVIVPRLHLAVFSEILQGIEQQARIQGYETIICTTNDDPKVEESIRKMHRLFAEIVGDFNQINIIISEVLEINQLNNLDMRAGGIAVVQLIRRQEAEINSVVADYEACGSEAVRFLVSKGCREIGLINGSIQLAPFRDRYQGYKKAIEKLGLEEITTESDRPVNSFHYGYDCAVQLIDENPDLDAIIASVDVQGLGAIRAAAEKGLKIPEDIRIMSLTGHKVGRMLETAMTAMEIPSFDMGVAAAKMAIEIIEADPKHKPSLRHISFNSTLVEREST